MSDQNSNQWYEEINTCRTPEVKAFVVELFEKELLDPNSELNREELIELKEKIANRDVILSYNEPHVLNALLTKNSGLSLDEIKILNDDSMHYKAHVAYTKFYIISASG